MSNSSWRRPVLFSMFTWARWRAGCGWPGWTPPTAMTLAMMPSSSRRTPAAGCCSPRTAACCAAGRCGGAPTCGARALMTSSGTCWTGSGRRWRHGPGARRATGRCPRSPRRPWPPCCLPAPGAPTRRSLAAAAAARCTGTAPTASDLGRSSTWQSAPSALAQANKSYPRQKSEPRERSERARPMKRAGRECPGLLASTMAARRTIRAE
jgi:hypothetical protein